MTQDRASGAAASAWGRDTARKLAAQLGATIPSGASNECSYRGERVVIKCAASATDQVGVLYHMLPRLDRILGAFERDDGRFDVWTITPHEFTANERPTRSKGRSAGRVGKVRRTLFETSGTFVGVVSLE